MVLRRIMAAPFRCIARLRAICRRRETSPDEIVQANTREAFNIFFSCDAYVAERYLHPKRLALFEEVADYCAGLLRTEDGRPVDRAVDIGCGTGHLLKAIRARSDAGRLRLCGLDFAASAIARAKALVPEATFIERDLYENGLPDGSFDLVVCTETLEHLHSPSEAVAELLRVCARDGSVVVTVPNGERDSWPGHISHWTPSQFESFLGAHGLADLRLIRDGTCILARLAKPR